MNANRTKILAKGSGGVEHDSNWLPLEIACTFLSSPVFLQAQNGDCADSYRSMALNQANH